MSASLLVELFTEELPPKALKQLGDAFGQHILDGLKRAQLTACDPQSVRIFATPRRLAVHVPRVVAQAPDRSETRKLMPSKVAFGADGNPSAALVKRLEKEGVGEDCVERRVDGNAEYVFVTQTIRGMTLAAGLQLALEEATAKLPIPKVMSYQLDDGATTVQFVRPAHGLVALHGPEAVPVSILGLKAGRTTHGHRFQGAGDIVLATADDYEQALAGEGRVIPSFDTRRAEVARQLAECAATLNASLGDESGNAALLDEVTALVEYPAVYTGEFDRQFLSVPQECLTLTMRQNQKYFPLFDAAGRLTNRFLIVSNMRLDDPRNIVEGNQRVVRPRLADARFFFETDQKTPLEQRLPRLAHIVYHNKLGTQLDRTERLQRLAGRIARELGADATLAERAARLAKADLTTGMVGEFPELQGVMGRYYARHHGEPEEVADAIEAHYRPRFAGDRLPQGAVACSVALADKLEALAGMFGIGQQPTGDRDPFALRRHALGAIRILIEEKIALPLNDLISAAFAVFPSGMLKDAHAELESFVFERLRGYLREAGYTANEIESVLCLRPALLSQVPVQMAAVRAFARLPEAGSLAAANKRVVNILKQAEAKGESFMDASGAKLREPAERELFDALASAAKAATPLFDSGDYTGYLKTFAVLKSPVDAFFDSVMVMVDDPALRQNRLALLAALRREMNRVADLSKLAA
jgi:glycyl-tRNA synthetase beta chain